MTELADRPTGSAAGTSAGGADRATRGGRLATAWARLRGRQERSLAGAAALAAGGAVVGGLAATMVLALAGWYLAEGGAYGSTTSALGVAVQAWLLAHGARLSLGGVPFGLVPLTLTLGQAWLLWRLARRAGRTATAVDDGGSAPAATDHRSLAQAATVLVGVYLVLVTAVCVLSGTGSVSASIPRAIGGAVLLAALAGPVGLAQGAGAWPSVRERVPGWVRSVLRGAAVSVGLLLGVATLLVVVCLGFGVNDAMAMLAGLRLDGTDQVAYVGASLLLLPNAVLMAAAYLLGPGFAVGAGSVVAPSAVVLGPLPAFPLLAGLPDPGTTPGWLMGVLAVPVLAALLGAGRAQASYAVAARDSAALRGFGVGAVGGLLTTALVWLAGGPVGTGRLAQVGASVTDVAVFAVGSMALAGLVGGFAVALWQRRTARRVARQDT